MFMQKIPIANVKINEFRTPFETQGASPTVILNHLLCTKDAKNSMLIIHQIGAAQFFYEA